MEEFIWNFRIKSGKYLDLEKHFWFLTWLLLAGIVNRIMRSRRDRSRPLWHFGTSQRRTYGRPPRVTTRI